MSRILVCALILCGVLWPSPVRADVITVDWNVVPQRDGRLVPTIHYDCFGDRRFYRSCQFLWEKNLELRGELGGFYEDKWTDGYGLGTPEHDIPGPFGAVNLIQPVCKRPPCFETFTPLSMVVYGGYDEGPPPNVFIYSSKGGLVKLHDPTNTVVDFVGEAWLDIASLELGFFLPAYCVDEPWEEGCDAGTEKSLIVQSLTFARGPRVPEPATLSLLGLGIIGVLTRRLARRRR